MKNVSHSPVTEMLSGKYKIWLMIGLALLPIADLSACIALWVFGAASAYWTIPFLMTIVDIAYLLCVALSNQRFKYAQKLFFVYIAITIILFIVWIAKFSDSNEVMLANTTEAACGLLHVMGILAVGISYLYASRRVRFGRHIQLVLAITFSAVALLALVIIYGVTVIGDGYFGQGHGNLPLVYSYIGDDACEVTDIVYGRGDSVVVPYEFNGRKVTKVSAKVFTYANIKSVTLNCDSNVELCTDLHSYSGRNADIIIYADKKAVDTFKSKLYQVEKDYYWADLALGNHVRPIGLGKDEAYVTFNYDHDSYLDADQNIIPTWYGKKGDTFKLSDIKDVDYAEYSDASSDEDLIYCYYNVGYNIGSAGGGYIMSELKDGGKAIDGAVIGKSLDNVPVRFQKIYQIFAGKSNDTMYDTADHFAFTTANGVTRDYKLTVADKADELLQQFDRGEAFTRTMMYKPSGGSYYQEFTSLAVVLRTGNNGISIAPYWDLVKPQVTLSQADRDARIFYGDDFELTTSVTHPLDGAQIEYEWFGIQGLCNDESIIQHASDVGIKTFSVVATVRAPQITSRVSANAAELTVSMLKRPLNVKWRMEGGGDVFDGNTRQILNEVENAADGDIVMINGYYDSGYAGTFTIQAEFVNSSQADKYTIVQGKSYTYTIKPCPVALTWDEQNEFEYAARIYYPRAHAFDLAGEELVINYSGYGIDAGNYSTTAEILNKNYVIDDASQKTMKFKITPKPVDVTWSNTELTYTGSIRVPTASASGVDNELVNLNITGGQINANMIGGNKTTTYTATATSASQNYTLNQSTASTEFTIEPYVLTNIQWTNTVVTYNGRGQLPAATCIGVKSQVLFLTVTIEDYPDGAINAGTYTATATVADPNYTIYDGPLFAYEDITSDLTAAQWQFIILPMEVSVVWGNDLTYNGKFQMPTATAKGIGGENLPLSVTGSVIRIGDGVAEAEFAAEQRNYTLANPTQSFTIKKKVVNIVIDNVTVEYGQKPEYTYSVTGVVDGEYVTVLFNVNYRADQNGNIPVGEYTITATLDITSSSSYTLNVVQGGKLTVTAPTQSAEDRI